MEPQVATGEAVLRARLRGLVREQPWLAVAAAAAAGGVLGGMLLSRAGKLAFAATAGYVVHDLWNREGKLAVNDIVQRLSGDGRDGRDGRDGDEAEMSAHRDERVATRATR